MQFADIQGSLETPSTSKTASPSKAVSEAPTSPTLSPDPSQGLIQGEPSQGSLDQPSVSGKCSAKKQVNAALTVTHQLDTHFLPT